MNEETRIAVDRMLAILEPLGKPSGIVLHDPSGCSLSIPCLEVRNGGILTSVSGRGETPVDALYDLFDQLIGFNDDSIIKVHQTLTQGSLEYRNAYFKWNGHAFVQRPNPSFE